MKYTFVLILVISGCGPAPSDFGPFADMVYEYDRQAAMRSKEYSLDALYVELSDFDNPAMLGLCRWTDNGSIRHIQINRAFWEATSITDAQREMVVFHELGHCVNNMQHIDNEYSIMNTRSCVKSKQLTDNTYCLGSQDYAENRAYYLDKHFASVQK